MKESVKKEGREKVTRRGFLKFIVPGLVATGVSAAVGAGKAAQDGAYGNGPYGGVKKPSE